MCKVIKDYGVVASNGSKELKLQTIYDANKEKCLALVSYKDGMSVRIIDITVEAKELKKLLEEYLDYKTPTKETDNINDIIKSLISLSAGDINYQTTLREATEEDINKAIEIMESSDGKHATRIRMCQNSLSRRGKAIPVKTKKVTSKKEEPKKETAKIIQFPTEDKRPKVVKLTTKGENTYNDCVIKLNKEAEMFKDSDSQYVIEGLLELCKVDQDFCNNVMREDKTYGGFMEYMYKAAQGGYCIKYGNVGWLDRDMGLGLAIDYYNTDIEKIKAEEKELAEKRKAEAEKKKKGAKANGKNVRKKKDGTAK